MEAHFICFSNFFNKISTIFFKKKKKMEAHFLIIIFRDFRDILTSWPVLVG